LQKPLWRCSGPSGGWTSSPGSVETSSRFWRSSAHWRDRPRSKPGSGAHSQQRAWPPRSVSQCGTPRKDSSRPWSTPTRGCTRRSVCAKRPRRTAELRDSCLRGSRRSPAAVARISITAQGGSVIFGRRSLHQSLKTCPPITPCESVKIEDLSPNHVPVPQSRTPITKGGSGGSGWVRCGGRDARGGRGRPRYGGQNVSATERAATRRSVEFAFTTTAEGRIRT
jgi:hypothetical protein